VGKLSTIAVEAGLSIEFYATPETIKELQDHQRAQKAKPKVTYHTFSNWNDFLIFSREVKKNDLLVITSSRKGHVSYHQQLEKLPYYLSNYFGESSFIMLYPKQVERGIKRDNIEFVDGTLAETISEKVGSVTRAGGFLKRLFGKEKS
jgi:hypothetical protein